MPDPLDNVTLITGDCREVLAGMEPGSVQCVVTSPPYWSLRDYNLEPSVWGGDAACEHEWGMELHLHKGGPQGSGGQRANRANVPAQNAAQDRTAGNFCSLCGAWRGCLGLEPQPDLYVAHIVEVFRGVKRVLREDGVLWLNLGSSYCGGGRGGNPEESVYRKQATNVGSVTGITKNPWPIPPGFKPKDLINIPHFVSEALRADGWYLRAALPWVKRSSMPESASDRPNSAVEYVFQLTKQPKYYFDMEAVRVAAATPWHGIGGWREGNIDNTYGPPEYRNDERERAGRHFRNGDLWFQSIGEPHGMVFLDDEPVGLDVTPAGFGEAHFATFPPKLVEPLIKAGTSEKGCCPECGKPWERITEKKSATMNIRVRDAKKGILDKKSGHSGRAAATATEIAEYGPEQMGEGRTLRWLPGCDCGVNALLDYVGGEDVPPSMSCTVLDPFSGAGTVALVAAHLGRRAIGIEAKAEYNAMAEKRIGQALRPATYQDQSEPGPGEATLFEETNP